MRYVEAICLTLVTAAVVVLLGEGALFVRDARRDLDANNKELMATILDAHRTVLVAGGAITNIEKGTRQFQTQQIALASSSQKALNTLDADLSSLGSLLSTGSSLLSSQQQSLNQLESEASQSIKSTTEQAASLVPAARETLTTLNTQLADPAIHDTLVHVDGTSAEVEGTAHDVHVFVHRETEPIRGTWEIIKHFLFEVAGPASNVASAIK